LSGKNWELATRVHSAEISNELTPLFCVNKFRLNTKHVGVRHMTVETRKYTQCERSEKLCEGKADTEVRE